MLVEVSMYPVGQGESLSQYIAPLVDIIDKSGLNYHLGPMGTTLEGEWNDVFGVIQKCFEHLSKKCGRVEFIIKGDHRRGHQNVLSHKVQVVEEKLGRKLKRS